MKITIIGCGKMGSGIAQRLAAEHDLTLCDHQVERTIQFAKQIQASHSTYPSEAITGAEIILLAVKPHDLSKLAKQIQREIKQDQLICSILAGVTTHTLRKLFHEAPLVRMMPNIAARFGQGVIGVVDSQELSQSWKDKVHQAFKSLGSLHWLPEFRFDALTALTGSGPAFLFMIVESIIDSGIAMGFNADESRKLALELLESSFSVLKETGKHPGELKWEVASPAGTTIAGIKMLEDLGIRAAILNGFLAAFERAQDLSRE